MARANYREMQGPNGHLAHRREFDGNSMNAEWITAGSGYTTGRLNYMDKDALYTAIDRIRETGERMYVIYSYATPIAWAIEDEPAYIVGDRFSVTTSKGQGYVRAWIDHYATATA